MWECCVLWAEASALWIQVQTEREAETRVLPVDFLALTQSGKMIRCWIKREVAVPGLTPNQDFNLT